MANNFRLRLVSAAVWLIAACATPALAQPAASPFPMHHGVNVPELFERSRVLPAPGPDGQVSDWAGPPAGSFSSPAELKAMGFDFVRLPVNPAVLLQNPPAVRARMLARIAAEVDGFLARGVRVVVDLSFWSPADKVWTDKAIIASPDPAIFENYRVLVVQTARALSQFPAGQVALELANEPAHSVCETDPWFKLQMQLYKSARQAAPNLPLMLTGCACSLDELAKMTPANSPLSDPSVLFTFHFYEPYYYTHQGAGAGYIGGVPLGDLRALPYPPRSGDELTALSQTNAAIEQERLPFASETAAKFAAARAIRQYFSDGDGRAFIDRRLDVVTAWAKANHIPTSRILMGEFAAINWLPTDTPDRLRMRLAWDNDVKASADARGVAWAYWFLPFARGPIFR